MSNLTNKKGLVAHYNSWTKELSYRPKNWVNPVIYCAAPLEKKPPPPHLSEPQQPTVRDICKKIMKSKKKND